MPKVWGGDTIETVDGRVGVVCGTMFNIGPDRTRETEYTFRMAGDTDYPRFTTGPDGKYESGDRSHRAYQSEIARIVTYGRHDYVAPKAADVKIGNATRGLCDHCGVRKADHG